MSESADYVNQVVLRGRVSHVGEERELPSGDLLRAWRLVVPRVGTGAQARRSPVDVIDVTCWCADTREAVARLTDGDVVTVEGALRRRFFRTAAGVASRYEVEAATVVPDRAVDHR